MAVQAVSVVNYQVPPPEKFSFKPEDWTRWIRRFERFRKATGLDQKSGENQVNTLVYSMGKEADDIMVSFALTADDATRTGLRVISLSRGTIYSRELSLTSEVNKKVSQLKPSLLIYIVSRNTVNLAY